MGSRPANLAKRRQPGGARGDRPGHVASQWRSGPFLLPLADSELLLKHKAWWEGKGELNPVLPHLAAFRCPVSEARGGVAGLPTLWAALQADLLAPSGPLRQERGKAALLVLAAGLGNLCFLLGEQ